MARKCDEIIYYLKVRRVYFMDVYYLNKATGKHCLDQSGNFQFGNKYHTARIIRNM